MSFVEAVRTVLSKYATFSGRARRAEYWWFSLFAVIVYVLAALVDSASGSQVAAIVAFVALILPSIAVTVRRLHDTGRSGWWYLISLVPLAGGIVLLVFTLQDSEPGANKYGPSPKAADAAFESPNLDWGQSQS